MAVSRSQEFVSLGGSVATLAFLGWIAAVVALASQSDWVNGTITQETTTPGNGISTVQIVTTYIEGSLSLLQSKVCAVSTTVPNNGGNRPSTQCTATGFSGSPMSIYIGSGCNTIAGSPYKVCNALGAMVGATGFTTFLMVMMIILFGATFMSAAGITYRASKTAEAAAAAGVSKDPFAPGSWLRFGQHSLDQATPLVWLSGINTLLGLVWIITWPSAIRNVFSLIIADLQSTTQVPQNSSISWSQNPMPGSGYWVVFGGVLAVFASGHFAWKLRQLSKEARNGSGATGMSPLFNPLDGGAAAAYLPPPAMASGAAPAAAAVAQGETYAALPSQ